MTAQAKLVTVFGGSGFLGRYVVQALTKRGYRVKVAVRRPELANHVQPLGDVGQVMAVQANLRYDWSVENAVKGADCVVNLVGILRQSGKQKFSAVQAEGARAVAQAAKKEGATLVHVSALGADLDAASRYGKTKAEAEEAVLELVKKAIILRPSIIFGQEDEFFNRFAAMTRLFPFVPVIGGGKTKIQPVYVNDVAEAVAKGVDGQLKGGKIYELGGPEVVTYREAMDEMLANIDRKCSVLSLPWFVAKGLARLTGWMPGAPITMDEVLMLGSDNVVSDAAKKQKLTLEGMGIEPIDMGTILPTYLVQYRPSGQFSREGVA